MRLKELIFCVLCITVAAGLFFLGAYRLDDINSQRSRMKLSMNEPLENAPPSLAFATVALGAFRGLVVDVLWIRADQLKEQGKFFDAKQLAEWITLLQPRFAAVWDFQAWNMAYNISVTVPETRPQERWHWVKNGIELLRDKGIEKNPHNIALYRSLAWIFQHKIGGVTDNVHTYYKLQLYNAVKPLLGPQTQEYYKALADAPEKLEEITQKPDVKKFLDQLASADSSFAKYQSTGRLTDELVDNYLSLRQQPERFSKQAFEIIDSFRGTSVLEEFDTFAKAYHLRHTWKLEPKLMAELNEKYGPIDYNDPNRVLPLNWTLADVHAIYWAALGIQKGGRQEYSLEELNTDRIVFHSLQNLYRMGKMIVYTSRVPSQDDPCDIIERQSMFLFPDLRMFDRYDQALRVLMKKYAQRGGNVLSLQTAHKNTLKRGVLLFYQAGHIAKAVEVYKILQKDYPEDEDIHVPIAEYARNRLIHELEELGFNDAREIITLMLQEAYYRYAVQDDDEAFGREEMAKEIYDHYQKQYEKEMLNVDRVVMPDFNTLRYIGISSFMNDLRYPDFVRQNLMERIRIERPQLYEQLKQQHESLMQEMEKQEGSQQ